MRREQGRADIDRMLADAELQRVPASREHANALIKQARTHLSSAAAICDCDQDPSGAYALVYDAARKALTAILEMRDCDPPPEAVQ